MLSLGTFVFLCFLFFLVSLSTVFAQNPPVYTPLIGIPGLATGQGTGLASYLNRLYIITIGIGAIIAFIKIAMAGVKWSMSDVITDKGAAKEDIKGALLGLAILLIPFIVLNTIYPGLTSLNILQNAGSSRLDLRQTSTPPAAPSTNPDDIARPQDVRVGQINYNCQYDSITEGTDMFGVPIVIGYDDTNCRAGCATRSGSTFTQLSELVGRCTYYEAAECGPMTGTPCPGESPVGA